MFLELPEINDYYYYSCVTLGVGTDIQRIVTTICRCLGQETVKGKDLVVFESNCFLTTTYDRAELFNLFRCGAT